MITNTGKNILAKYLIGQAPAYASFIAIGCGPTPKASDHIFTTEEKTIMSEKTSLDFEMQRFQITSRGFVTEVVDGSPVSKIVLTAEIDSEPRYEITEVGVYSAGSNTAAGSYDSKLLYSFDKGENWEYHNQETASAINVIPGALDTNITTVNGVVTENTSTNNILGAYNINGSANPVDCEVFRTTASNTLFNSINRSARYERSRYEDDMLLIRGNSATINVVQNHLVPTSDSDHIHLTGTSIDLSRNSTSDEIKFAFSIVNTHDTPTEFPKAARVIIEFASTDSNILSPLETDTSQKQWARFELDIKDISEGGSYDFANNRYYVATKQLQELYRSSGFTWNAVNTVKVYSSIYNRELVNNVSTLVPSNKFYLAIDALRLDNLGSVNPLYGLTGYSVIKNTDAATIVKKSDTTGYIEFRFSMEV
jgi:hypothetical protein